jgi:flavin-dependent dehydrogenase
MKGFEKRILKHAFDSDLFADGLLVAGDAGGLVVNSGLTLRGMDMAIASGVVDFNYPGG